MRQHGDRTPTGLAPTPTRNLSLAFRRGGFASLCDALDYAAQGETGLSFYDARGRLLDSLPYGALRHRALTFARRLASNGFARGERLLLIADTFADFCVAFFGAQYSGLLPVPVPVPVGLGAKASYIEQLGSTLRAAGGAGILAPEELAAYASAAAEGTTARLAGSMSTFETALPDGPVALSPLGAGEQGFVQYSSGSTRAPLGVDVRQAQLMANIDGILAMQEVAGGDSAVSWLPLYHDMGLIGFFLVPLCAQLSVDLLAPRDFARRPLQWLSLISRRRATISFSPSFGYDLAVRRGAAQVLEDLDLSSWRHAGIGGDMVRPDVLDHFARLFEPRGFRRQAFMPSYGMAEACLAITFCPDSTGVRTDTIDRKALAEKQLAVPAADPQDPQGARRFVICGRVLPGHRLEIRDEAGNVLADRRVGRIFVAGPSIMPGYFGDPEASRAALSADGWLDTGDLGYRLDGEVVITGRAKDLIIVNGRNIWPQDIEWAVEALPQLRRGDACAFSVPSDGGEIVVVVVQSLPSDPNDRRSLFGDIRQKVKETVGVDCQIVLISRQIRLPLTSSGKLSRVRAKARFIAGGYADEAAADRAAMATGA